MMKANEFWAELDKSYNEWLDEKVLDSMNRCEAAIADQFTKVKELTSNGLFLEKEKDSFRTETISIPGNAVLEKVRKQLEEYGYSINIESHNISDNSYGEDIYIYILIR